MTAAAPDLIDLELHLHHDAHRDILVSRDGGVETRAWLRKSLIEYAPAGRDRVFVTLPRGLAVERGLA